MEHQTIADNLLWPIWRGIPDGYKMRYARSIWQQFEDNLRSSAYTSSLSKFLETVCVRLGVDLSAKELMNVRAVIESQSDQDVLRKLRNETTYLVLLVRLRNEERKVQIEAAKREREEESTAQEALL